MVIRVRRIRPDEGSLLKRIRLAALADTPSAFAKTFEEESTYPDAAWAERAAGWSDGAEGATFFAEVDGEVRGLVGGHRPDDAELVSMWVEPAARGTGVAEALVGAVVNWADGPVELWVTHGNDRAIAFYRRMGFVETDEFQPLPSDPCKNEVRMRLVPA
ncbi:MAG: GNAT family N-acetyltransferase [Actinomycetota bacterium]